MSRVLESLRSVRGWLLLAVDAAAWLAAVMLVDLAWQVLGGAAWTLSGSVELCILVVAVQQLIWWTVGLLGPRAPVGGRTTAFVVTAVACTAGFWSGVVNAVTQWVPYAVPLVATPVALALQLGGRASWRLARERMVARRAAAAGAKRTLVVGFGSPARELVRSMMIDPKARFRPVGFVALDPTRLGERACGLPVLGTDTEIAPTLVSTRCEIVVLATPRLEAGMADALARNAQAAGCTIKALAGADTRARRTWSILDLRDVPAPSLRPVPSSPPCWWDPR